MDRLAVSDRYRANAAKVAELPAEKVQLHTTFLGGGFGRRANPQSDFVVEAVHVAKAAGAPVKGSWTREEDMAGRGGRRGASPVHSRGRGGGRSTPCVWVGFRCGAVIGAGGRPA